MGSEGRDDLGKTLRVVYGGHWGGKGEYCGEISWLGRGQPQCDCKECKKP